MVYDVTILGITRPFTSIESVLEFVKIQMENNVAVTVVPRKLI